MIRGRTRPTGEFLDLIALVTSVPGRPPAELGPEHLAILSLCTRATSVVDVAAELDLPLGVVRVLLGDLLEQRLVMVRPPARVAEMPSERILKEVINGLRAL
ncbi:DUF742 domain-containing protein [Rhizohabitans arisaemae]|uniref:DUF742 domain-containing protein n=1 Tax=Rhizohabitans arisaemae TaxID=2720610 RepID=UPI0024B12A96|nr:DUF742 domain-containing protein [Rhizohabitans arisaemae]